MTKSEAQLSFLGQLLGDSGLPRISQTSQKDTQTDVGYLDIHI